MAKGGTLWSYVRTAAPAWLAGAALSYVAIRMGLFEHYRLALLATGALAGVLALNPGLQRLAVGFLAPLTIVLGFYSQWIPSMVEGSFSPRQEEFLQGLNGALIASATLFLLGSLMTAARVALWIAVLFLATYLLATYSGSAGRASNMIDWFISTFGMDREAALRATVWTRKSIHVGFYALVGWSAFWSAWHGNLRGLRVALYALAVALILACFDESRQLNSAGRGGSGWDVALDMAGASAAILLCVVVSGLKSRRRAVNPSTETSP